LRCQFCGIYVERKDFYAHNRHDKRHVSQAVRKTAGIPPPPPLPNTASCDICKKDIPISDLDPHLQSRGHLLQLRLADSIRRETVAAKAKDIASSEPRVVRIYLLSLGYLKELYRQILSSHSDFTLAMGPSSRPTDDFSTDTLIAPSELHSGACPRATNHSQTDYVPLIPPKARNENTLPEYSLPKPLLQAVDKPDYARRSREYLDILLPTALSTELYARWFSTLLWVEEGHHK
jgi:hypothetical protein